MGLQIEGMVGQSAMDLRQRMAILESIPKDRPASMLEIGTLHGVSAAFWARERPQALIVSLDPFQKAIGTGPGFIENWHTNHRSNQILIVGTSAILHKFKIGIGGEGFDVCFVDGDHSEEGCWMDMEVIRSYKLLKPGGAFIIHDYGTRNPELAGVTVAVDKFCLNRGYRISQRVGVAVWLEPVK